MPDIYWGKGKRSGSFNPGLTHLGKWHQIIGVWTNGYVEFQFQYMKSRGSLNDEQRLELLRRFDNVFGTSHSDEQIHRRPGVELAAFVSIETVNRFLAELEWARQQILTNYH
jgi:hypothetical protein